MLDLTLRCTKCDASSSDKIELYNVLADFGLLKCNHAEFMVSDEELQLVDALRPQRFHCRAKQPPERQSVVEREVDDKVYVHRESGSAEEKKRCQSNFC